MTTNDTQKAHRLPFYGSKEGNDVGILLDSKVVIEKKNFVSTGVLSYASGEMIEVEIPEYDLFQLGEKVRAIVYTQSGMFVFESMVVAKDSGSLIIINPPENRKKFNEKREYPRINIQKSGLLHAIHDLTGQTSQVLQPPVAFAVNNVSMGGAGFLFDTDPVMKQNSRLEVELDFGFSFTCTTEIVRAEKFPAGFYYGVFYAGLAKEQTNALRAFILKNQVEEYYKQKKEEKMKLLEDSQSKRYEPQASELTGQGMHIVKQQ